MSSNYWSLLRAPELKRGVNMFDWFMGPNIYSTDHQTNYITASGMADLKSVGFTHIRLPIYGKFVADVDYIEAPLRSDRIASLDKAIDMAQRAGLAVILTLFPEDEMYRLSNNLWNARTVYTSWWTNIANRYARKYTPGKLFFEICNEPHFQAFMSDTDARASWEAVKPMFINAIRQVTKAHWILVPSYDWNTVQNAIDYNQFVPNDPLIIYTAHYYEFILFTHQGVEDFGDPVVVAAQNFPYPVRQPECSNAVAAMPAEMQGSVSWYCGTGFGASTIDTLFAAFKAWGQQHNVPLYLGEFGAYRAHSIPGDAEQWMNDVRVAAEENEIPWATWSYKGAFEIQSGGVFHPTVMTALGLKTSP